MSAPLQASQSSVAARRAVLTLCGVQFVDVLGVTSAITSIPAIVADLAVPGEFVGLLATTYAAFFGGLLVLGSRLGDKYGSRKVLLAGLGLFTATALVGASAGSVAQLLVAIALQGTAAAVSVPCALQLLLHATPATASRHAALAWWSASGAAAGVLGYVVGGVLTDQLGWRAVYAVNAPIGLALAAAVVALVAVRPALDRSRRLDVIGAALLIAAVTSAISGASLLERPAHRAVGAVALAASLAIAAAFAARQRRAATPLIPVAAFASTNLRTGSGVSFVNTATTSSAGVLATLLLQQQLGATATQAALTLLPFSLAVIAGSALTRPLTGRLPAHRIGSLGLAGVAAGNLVLALTVGASAGVIAGVTIAGLGLGLASFAANAIGTDLPTHLAGSATGILNTAAQLGTALGVAALITLAATIGGIAGTAIGWAVAAGVALLAALHLATQHREA